MNKRGLAKPAISKDESKDSYDYKAKEEVREVERNTTNVMYPTRYSSTLANNGLFFQTNMDDKNILVSFMMVEDDPQFKDKTIQEKIATLTSLSSDDVRGRYYDARISGKLPEEWEAVKMLFSSFCMKNKLVCCRKYQEEAWYEYVDRINIVAETNRISAEALMEHLRKLQCNNEIMLIFLTHNDGIKSLVQKLQFWEQRRSDMHNGSKRHYHHTLNHKGNTNNKNFPYKEWKCYRCNQKGHTSSKCPTNVESLQQTNGYKDDGTDEREVEINGFKYFVQFDTGSASNFICLGDIAALKLQSAIYCVPKKIFRWINGATLTIEREVKIKFRYVDDCYEETFYVIENHGRNVIFGNRMIKRLSRQKKGKPGNIMDTIECAIETPVNETVSWTRPIRNPVDKKDFLSLVEKMEIEGVIEPSKSMWLNPVVLMRKKTGDLRFCIDFRRLNDKVVLDGYALPRITDILSVLGDNVYFTAIDLKDGFFQIPVKPEHKHKTAFLAGNKLMQFRKMPQGYKNSPAIFQRVMDLLFSDLIGFSCVIYIDDILVFGKTSEEHDINLEKVCRIMKDNNLIENIAKRRYKRKTIEFLGYTLGNNKISPNVNRAQGIIDFQKPKTKKQLQRFLGLINYDRKFVPNLALLASPLYNMIKKENVFKWTVSTEDAFQTIKHKWANKLEVVLPNLSEPFILETDASDLGLGAVLRQEKGPVAYISRILSGPERNYSITEKEVLAALWAMDKFEYFIGGKEFKLITDHKAMEELKTKAEFGSARIRRWFERLDRHNFKVEYRKGIEMIVPDALSRSEPPSIPLKEGEVLYSVTLKEVLKTHEECAHRKNIRTQLRDKGIFISENKLRLAIKSCKTCNRMDKKYPKGSGFIQTKKPGELFGIDILEIKRGKTIMIGIDYYTRKVFAKVIKNKEQHNAVEFLKFVLREFPVHKIITDNGKEFSNNYLKEFCKLNMVEHQFSIPHYHNQNGRVERVNRTLRESIQKLQGSLSERTNKAVRVYNNSRHRGIGMTPIEAGLAKNKAEVEKNQLKYMKEFKAFKKKESYEIGDEVLVKNEEKLIKSDVTFIPGGKISEKRPHGGYMIQNNKGRKILRHWTQIKKLVY